MPGSPCIRLNAASVSLGGKAILSEVTWSLTPGEHWLVLGPNGAGKSSFLRLLRGELRPDRGPGGAVAGTCVWNFSGREETSPLAARPVVRLVSAEQQRFYSRLAIEQQWPMTGLSLVAGGFADALFSPATPPDEEAAAYRMLERFGGAAYAEKPVRALSQGQFRLLLLARAMVSAPAVLLLDEALDGLDSVSRELLFGAVEEAAQSASLICSAHRQADVPGCIGLALILDKGRIRYSGTRAGLPVPDGLPRAARLPSLPPAPEAMPSGSSPVLELENVSVYVDRVKVLHSLSWQVLAGENWRISGPNGAGKSTLVRLLAGLEQAAAGGAIRWFGGPRPSLEELQRRLGVVSDSLHALYGYDLSGEELVCSGFDGHIGLWREIRDAERAEARRWMEVLGIDDLAGRPISSFSSGTARRFFLARALAGRPRLLLLDEPCSGLDAPSRGLVLEALNEAMRCGVQCLYISHHDEDVPSLISRELCLEQCRIVYAGRRRGLSPEAGGSREAAPRPPKA